MIDGSEPNGNGKPQRRFEVPDAAPGAAKPEADASPVDPAAPRRDPWEKQEGESAKAFEAFVIYRDLAEDRSQVKVAEALGKNITLMARWSSRWKWVERVDAWDREQDRLLRIQMNRERRAMVRRHAQQFKAVQTAAVKFMEVTFGKGFEHVTNETMTVTELIRILDIASKGERIAMGEPETITEHQHTGGNDDDGQTVPLTFGGRIGEALALLEAARERAAAETAEPSD